MTRRSYRRQSFSFFAALLAGALAAACSGPIQVGAPAWTLSAAQDPVAPQFAAFAPRALRDPVHEVFTTDAPAARTKPWVRDLLSQLPEAPRPAMTTGELARLLRALAGETSAIGNDAARAALRKELDDLLTGLGTEAEATVTSRIGPAVKRDRWVRHPSASVGGLVGYFHGGNGEITVPLALHQGDTHAAYLDDADAERVVAITAIAERALELNLDPAAVQDKLEQNANAWRNVLHRGYAQFPWESFVNGMIDGSAWDNPPAWQGVLLHPEAGVLVGLDDLRRTAADPALLVHGVGAVRYFGARGKWFLGASATVALPDDESTGIAYGVTLLGGSTSPSSSLPHISVGLLWSDGDDDGLQLALGIDLMRLASRAADR
jgi:hypothetical protein